MQRSDLPPNGSVCAGTHAPYAFRCGKDEESAQHATVAMRIESYDANWGYFTQAGPPSAREPWKTLRQAHGKSKCPKWFGFQPSPSGDGIGFPTCKKHRDRRIRQEIIGNQQTSAECGDDKPPAEMPGIMLTTPMVPQKYCGYKQGLDGFGVGIHPQQFGLDSSLGWLFQTYSNIMLFGGFSLPLMILWWCIIIQWTCMCIYIYTHRSYRCIYSICVLITPALYIYIIIIIYRRICSCCSSYPLVNQRNYGKSPFLLGKSTINGHF